MGWQRPCCCSGTAGSSGEQIGVELMSAEADELRLQPGDVVLVDFRHATIFAGDYAI